MAKAPKAKKSKAVVVDDVPEKKAKKGKKEAPVLQGFNVRSYFDEAMDMIEKKTKISSRSLAMRGRRLSTGLLALDMYLGGGLVPGSWTTVAGGEQSCKSTTTMSIVAAAIKTKFSGSVQVFDFEGSSDANYISNMLKTNGVTVDPKTIFGVPDPDGGWIVPPTIRYYAPDNAAAFFDFMSMMRRRLPDKIVEEDGTPYLIFENTKENKKIVGDKYDKKWFSKRNQFKVQATDDEMQILTLVDSYPAMLPDQVDDDEGSNAMALQARMFSEGIKRFRGGMRRKMMTILGVNQLRQRPATMYGDPAYEPCGDALKFYCFNHDLPMRTSHGIKTAPEIKELIAEGERVLVETAFGMQPVYQSWKVEEDRKPMTIESEGFTYTGSDQHRQLFLHHVQLSDGFHTLQTVWKTLDEFRTNPEGNERFAVLRMPYREELESDNMLDQQNELHPFHVDDFTYVEERVRTLSVMVESAAVTCKIPETVCKVRIPVKQAVANLAAHGIISREENGYLIIGVLHMSDVLYCMENRAFLSEELSERQRHFNLLEAFADSSEALVAFCILTGANIQNIGHVDSMLDTLLAGEPLPNVNDEDMFSILYANYDVIHHQLAYVEELLSFCDAPFVARFKIKEAPEVELWDITVPTSGTVITANHVSHNSDVRLRLVSRAVLTGWDRMKDRPGSMAEKSVDIEGGIDIYRFISAKTIKNKMGGIPNQTTWLRLWESDGNGEARGFDPVFDTYHFLKTVGLISGIRKKMKFVAPCPLAGGKPINWDDFRDLILGDKKMITEVCGNMGVKPGDLRKWCFKFLNSKEGWQAVKDTIAKNAKAADASEDDDE